MKRIGLVVGLVVVAFACSEQVGQMMMDAGDAMIPDAGAQSEFLTFDCNSANFVLTDIDFEYGKTIDHTRHPADRYGFESTRPIDFARYSSFSIDGKVLAACNGADTVRVEVLP